MPIEMPDAPGQSARAHLPRPAFVVAGVVLSVAHAAAFAVVANSLVGT
jgi:hypothetical protein